ncbi:MAG: hypothetical protein KGI80_04155 [Verrucomicrobiota bacterium]|nr:hypothetical protein [Verrucomicrobiota bacterium]
MSRFSLPLSACLLLTGCLSHHPYESLVRYHDDGRAKPVAVIPTMIDTTHSDVPWSIAEEMTSHIVRNVESKEQIYLQEGDGSLLADNPFNPDISWVKEAFVPQQFVVFLELVEHELIPAFGKSSQEEPRGNYLNTGIRVRIIDLRQNEPKIVLQEIVRDSYYIPRTYFPPNYDTASWGSEEYEKTPMGIAHTRIAQEISSRIVDYIILAQGR